MMMQLDFFIPLFSQPYTYLHDFIRSFTSWNATGFVLQ